MTFRSILLVGSLFALTAVSMAAETVHLYIKTSVQGQIKGIGRENSIECLLEAPRDLASGQVKSPRDVASGLGKGKRKKSNTMTLQMPVGEAGQQLFNSLCNNEVITECKVEMKDSSGKMKMITLKSPKLLHVSVSRKGTTGALYEEVILSWEAPAV